MLDYRKQFELERQLSELGAQNAPTLPTLKIRVAGVDLVSNSFLINTPEKPMQNAPVENLASQGPRTQVFQLVALHVSRFHSGLYSR